MQPQVILLKEGTDTSQGKPQLISNINACTAIVEILQTTLGPRGLDKLIYEVSWGEGGGGEGRGGGRGEGGKGDWGRKDDFFFFFFFFFY